MTLTELIESLEAHLESNPDDGDRLVVAVHQPQWPLQESIHGLWDSKTANDRELILATSDDDYCHGCEEPIKGKMAWRDFDDDDAPRWVCLTCTEADEDSEPEPLRLVVHGTPEGVSTYGPRQAFGAW
jgi:hypothetical protein